MSYRHAAQTVSISVVTPAWNAMNYIRETIVSVASQLGPDDEYIVVDDGSTDGTAALIEELCREYNLTVLVQARGGEIAAVNAGLAVAANAIICIVNADDPILPGLFDRMKAAFRQEPDLAAAYPDWLMIDEAGNVLRTVRTVPYSYRTMLAEHLCIPGPGAFFRKSAMPGEMWRDPQAEGLSDFDFWLRLGRNGARLRRIPETLATWRSHASGTTATFDGSKLATAKIDLIRRLFDRDDLSAEVRALRSQALSAAYCQAALLGLRRSGIPAFRYAAASYWHMPFWPTGVRRSQRRSLPHLAYASLQPVSGWCHRLIDPLLPARFRRSRVLSQRFGFE